MNRQLPVWTAILVVLVASAYLALGIAAYTVMVSAHPAVCHVATSTETAHERTC